MHSQWEELIPLYVAGMLSTQERDALEQHLAACDTCRRIFEEWRTTAAVVRDAAEQWSKGLPPLAPKLRERVAARGEAQNGTANAIGNLPTIVHLPRVPKRELATSQKRVRSRSAHRVPFTLAAAMIILFLFGGGLLFMALRPAPLTNALAIGVTGTVRAIQTAATLTERASTSAQATLGATEEDMGIILVATVTPSLTPVGIQPQRLPSTATPMPPIVLTNILPDATVVAIDGVTATDDFSIAANPVDSCTVSTAGFVPASVYQYAGSAYAVVGMLQPGETLMTNAINGLGWFQVVAASGDIWGWVNGVEVVVQGTLCASLQLPTPTQIAPPESDLPCIVVNMSGVNVNIFASPLLEASLVGILAADASARVSGRSTNGWIMIEFAAGSGVFSGWIDPSALATQGDCANLPVIG